MLSRSLRISCKFFVPRMFRNDVWKIDMIMKWRFVQGDDDNRGDDDDNDDLCKQSGRVMTIFNIGHADRRIWHPG